MMKDRKKLLPLLCAMYLTACATSQQYSGSGEPPLRVEPTVRVGASADAMYQLGRYYQGQNRFDQAINAYQKSLVVDSSEAEAHNGLGVVYSKLGKFDAAIEAFNAALQISPQSAHIHNNLGYAYYLQGQYDQALNSLNQAMALDPGNKRVQTNLDLVYEKTGEHQQVAQSIDGNPVTEKLTAGSREAVVTTSRSSRQEDTGVIVPAAAADVKVVQVAPAVYRLERSQPARAVYAEKSASKNHRIEVSNGNGITGMAKKVGAFLRNLGYAAARLTNQKPFNVVDSEVQYRSGYLQEAQKLQSELQGHPKLVQRDDLRSDINLRLLLGKDLIDDQGYFTAR